VTASVVVTGARGFIGREVVRQLRSSGSDVIEVHHAWGDAAELDRFVGDAIIDSCIHLGWYAEPSDYLINVRRNLQSLESSCVLVEWLEARGASHLVVAGSCAEYRESATAHDERDCPGPWSTYGAAKVALWYLLGSSFRPSGLTVAWARIFNVTGPGEHPDRLMPYVARRVSEGHRVPLSPGAQVRDYLDVEDVASALIALSRNRADGTFNVCSGVGVSLRSLLVLVAEGLGAAELLDFGARPYGQHDAMSVVGTNSALQQATGWTPSFDVVAIATRVVEQWRSDSGE
jgi:nucleoside-diphosphate-sugar epimerase